MTLSLGHRLGGMSGQCQEDIIQCRSAKADVVDVDAAVVEVTNDLNRVVARLRGWHRETPGVLVERAFAVACTAAVISIACAIFVAPVDDDLDPLAADLRLELVRRSPGDDPAVVDDRNTVGQLVGLFEILGGQQERRPFADSLADRPPTSPYGCEGRGLSSAHRE